MATIDELLDLYFTGQTSLEQEQELKDYFKSGEVTEAHAPYAALFGAFEAEAAVTMPLKEEVVKPVKRFSLRRMYMAGSGIAAAVIITFWLFTAPAVEGDYAIVNGQRIDNAEFAQQLAMEKFVKLNQTMERSVEPLDKLEDVRENIQSIKTFDRVQNKLDEYKNILE